MAENHTNGVRIDESVPMSAIFHVIGRQAEDVVSTALQQRPSASESARAALNAAIDNSGIKIGGFKKPSRAQPPDLLNVHVLDALLNDNDKLASAVLRVWTEALPELARVVTQHLEEHNVPVLDPKSTCFPAVWPQSICLLEGNVLSSRHREFNHHDVALMLSYLSGRFPEETALRSSLFSEWLGILEDLPPDAPEWDESHRFLAELVELSTTKSADHRIALWESFEKTIAGIAEQFGEELRYLGIDVSRIQEEAAARPSLIPPAYDLAARLQPALEAYREVRPQATTRDEELRRAGERDEREAEIFVIVEAWEELKASPEDTEEADAEALDGPDAPANITVGEYEALHSANQELASENTRLTQTNDLLQQAQDKLRAEKDQFAAENARLSEENGALQHANDKLRMEKDEESNENSRLKRELRESMQREEAWRGAPAPMRDEAGAEPNRSDLASVRIAVTRARSEFPDQLLIAPNSRSNEDTPYQRPAEVYDALAWLATDYHSIRSSPTGANPDFDKMLKETCPGWSYIPHQSAVTIGMFKDWYYTTADGTRYELTEHLGRGSSGNPQHTIRIAFAWDADLRKVIVGYIGHHQRNQGS